VTSIDTLPDEALLAIFDCYRRAWQPWLSLVHVCRRWRGIVFESPRRLNLQLICTGRRPARDILDVWPTLLLFIEVNLKDPMLRVDNIIAALERSDRVREIDLSNLWSWGMKKVLAAMQRPFPELTDLELWSNEKTVVVSDSFLGGSAPLLEHLMLHSIPFPGLPKLLLSATQLVTLYLHYIPHSGYFPPDAMATVLSTLTSLKFFGLQFISSRSCPDRESRRPPPSTRSVLPVFKKFSFEGVSRYLEDLVAGIDAPQLEEFHTTLFNAIVFDTPQVIRFLSQMPKSKALEKAWITLGDCEAKVKFSSQTLNYVELKVEILCKRLDWQLSCLEQVCTSCLPPPSMLEYLYFAEDPKADWKDNIDNELWVRLLRPFSAVKNLYLPEKVASRVALALQDVVEGRTTAVLPTVLPNLQNIFVKGFESSGSVQEGIVQFVSARQVAGQSIAVSRWTNEQRRFY
jgi:hypothetical protein